MDDKEKRKYKCLWPGCGEEFEQEVGYMGEKRGGSSVVTCPNCGARLKTDSNL